MGASHRLVIETTSPEETERLGCALATVLPVGAVVALRGELAAGKTCFVRGMAAHFTPGEAVSSPSFTIINEYGAGPVLYHVDLYRLGHIEEVLDLGTEDLFEPDGVCVVEWADRAQPLLPGRRLDVLFEHIAESCRRLTFTDVGGAMPLQWQQVLKRTEKMQTD